MTVIIGLWIKHLGYVNGCDYWLSDLDCGIYIIRQRFDCAERCSTAQYGGDLVTWCNVSNFCNMSAKKNSDSEYYGRDLVMWCNVSKVCNMSTKNNSDSEYYGRDLVTWCNVCNMSAKNNSDSEYYGRDFVTQNKK